MLNKNTKINRGAEHFASVGHTHRLPPRILDKVVKIQLLRRYLARGGRSQGGVSQMKIPESPKILLILSVCPGEMSRPGYRSGFSQEQASPRFQIIML